MHNCNTSTGGTASARQRIHLLLVQRLFRSVTDQQGRAQPGTVTGSRPSLATRRRSAPPIGRATALLSNEYVQPCATGTKSPAAMLSNWTVVLSRYQRWPNGSAWNVCAAPSLHFRFQRLAISPIGSRVSLDLPVKPLLDAEFPPR
jgi:hypothetical protein